MGWRDQKGASPWKGSYIAQRGEPCHSTSFGVLTGIFFGTSPGLRSYLSFHCLCALCAVAKKSFGLGYIVEVFCDMCCVLTHRPFAARESIAMYKLGRLFVRYHSTASAASRVPLAYTLHKPRGSTYHAGRPPIIFMHGLFGSRKNNRSMSKSVLPFTIACSPECHC